MAKVITDIYGFAQEIQRQFGCDRQVIEALCDRFSENVVIAAVRFDVAMAIIHIGNGGMSSGDALQAQPISEQSDIDFDRILDRYQGTDWVDVGYTYEALKDAVLRVYTEEQCRAIVQGGI